MKKPILPPAQSILAESKAIASRAATALAAVSQLSALNLPLPPPTLHLAYRIHWRAELRWRSARIEYQGHVDYDGSLTPEATLDAFTTSFPDREIVRLVAL